MPTIKKPNLVRFVIVDGFVLNFGFFYCVLLALLYVLISIILFLRLNYATSIVQSQRWFFQAKFEFFYYCFRFLANLLFVLGFIIIQLNIEFILKHSLSFT